MMETVIDICYTDISHQIKGFDMEGVHAGKG
jgi:hypothetical protein